jgi:hypothetical protein
MPAVNQSENSEAKKDDGLIEIEVTVDNHTHAGKPCKKGDKIKVSPEGKAMLDKAWKKDAPEVDK